MPHLEFRHGPRRLFVHLLRPGRTVIGRGDQCDVALPAEDLSRVHCYVESRDEGWWLVDRSRNGTRVNTVPIAGRHLLGDGDEVALGPYVARFQTTAGPPEAPTATSPLPAAIHEELVEVGDDGVATSRACLRFVRGPQAGRVHLLKQARTTVGGRGADLVLDPDGPATALRLRVVRGRVMVEPGDQAALLAGLRVRELIPALEGEEIRVGEHGFVITTQTDAEPVEREAFGHMVGRAPPMRRLFGVLSRMAAHDQPALLTGESGTGKELAARGLHDAGPRHDGPYVALNCAAITEALFESELFGHEQGAFTGATRRSDGAFQRAASGTLFLDEIGELRGDAQAKLLRALESGEVRRVGGDAVEFPDVRVVSATNRDLLDMVHRGTFRRDLYFRLAVLAVRIPPLRERPEDLALLARTLLQRNHPDAHLTEDAVARLVAHDWPGNVRELRNVLTRAYVLGGPVIAAANLEFYPWSGESAAGTAPATDDLDREAIAEALRANDGNRTRTAQALGIPRSSLLYKLKKYGL